jgi:phosphohistidine phosphatase
MAGRRLVVMRHAKAEPYADDDHGRRLRDRGRADAAEAGRYLASIDVVPDYALVSDATRTRETWEALRDACGSTAHEDVSREMYAAGTADALEAIRSLPDDARTAIFVGHNPTAGMLGHLLTDGEGDPEVVRGVLEGFPAAALAVFSIPGEWADLEEAGARITHFHVGRG